MPIASVNPATGRTLKSFETLSKRAIDEKLEVAIQTFREQRKRPYRERAAMLLRAGEIVEQNAEHFGRIMTEEMGKTLKSAMAEAQKCALACRYYAEHGERHLADEVIATNASRSFVRYQPLGPVLAIMPWNFPFWQVFRFAAPALMAGNVGLLKHASNVPQCALAIEEIFCRAGFPEGSFQSLLIESSQIEDVINDERIAAATLTGSEPAGQAVASQAGKQIKKTVLELGGSDPFIVMPSANFTEAVTNAVNARTINNGQSCIAAKRFIVAESLYDRFEPLFVRGMEDLKVGDPMDPNVSIGPIGDSEDSRRPARTSDACGYIGRAGAHGRRET